MHYILYVHISDYDRTLGRFKSPCFSESNDGGISVVEKDCILNDTGCVCRHALRFYSMATHTPPIFWDFTPRALFENCRLVQSDSSTGDRCHFNIFGLGDKKARSYFKKNVAEIKFGLLQICSTGGIRVLNQDDIGLALAEWEQHDLGLPKSEQ